ncbi:hypothetical protein EST62_00005 [Chlorobaculum sp. 24CR]|uniref:hypothetical protein n=1 Tax=Chlorobaculum sp. 24CR TaxID=2508878 RepID=UPI00100BC654|nr:hypothetical protein [Chlorobaculum sp. 24CR]RXK89562.1 hypothetical protein EST62_00005 [Chlorobaculum sp. 24CR]
MARGKSGRVVLEIDPELKRQLYAKLENKQQTMREWFIQEATELVYGEKSSSLFDMHDEDQQNIDGGEK